MALSIAWVIFGIAFFLFFVLSIVAAVFILNRLRWNFRWVLLEEMPNGQSQIVKKGRARLMSFGDGGEEIFYLKNMKKWRVAYGKRIAKNQVAWATGQDGYWYNIGFGPIDKKLREVGVYPVDRDMRYAYASARKGIDNRYDKKTFMEKYGTVIAFTMLFFCILAMGLFIWLGYTGQAKIANLNVQSLQIQKDVLTTTNDIVTRLGNLKSAGTSGIAPGPST